MSVEMVSPSRAHWVPNSQLTACSQPNCTRSLHRGTRHHCRRCGWGFCAEHLSCRMHLTWAAMPARSVSAETSCSAKVCQMCYSSADSIGGPLLGSHSETSMGLRIEGGDGPEPITRDLTNDFQCRRFQASQAKVQSIIDCYLKLCSPRRNGVPFSPAVASATLVSWRCLPECELCKAHFSAMMRRHHCRLCGRSACSACAPKRHACAGSLSDGLTMRVCQDCSLVLATWQMGERIASERRTVRRQQSALGRESSQQLYDLLIATKQEIITLLATLVEQVMSASRRPCISVRTCVHVNGCVPHVQLHDSYQAGRTSWQSRLRLHGRGRACHGPTAPRSLAVRDGTAQDVHGGG